MNTKCSFDILLWNKQKKRLNDYFHSSFKRATKKGFCNPPTGNWHPVRLSQETKSEQKTGEAERECCLLDRLTQPRGRHGEHLFQIPIVFVTGDWFECSEPQGQPTASASRFLEPRPVLLLTVFSLWSKSSFCYPPRRTLTNTQVIHIDSSYLCLKFLTHWTFMGCLWLN